MLKILKIHSGPIQFVFRCQNNMYPVAMYYVTVCKLVHGEKEHSDWFPERSEKMDLSRITLGELLLSSKHYTRENSLLLREVLFPPWLPDNLSLTFTKAT